MFKIDNGIYKSLQIVNFDKTVVMKENELNHDINDFIEILLK